MVTIMLFLCDVHTEGRERPPVAAGSLTLYENMTDDELAAEFVRLNRQMYLVRISALLFLRKYLAVASS